MPPSVIFMPARLSRTVWRFLSSTTSFQLTSFLRFSTSAGSGSVPSMSSSNFHSPP
jgi:hypothetical protein